MWILEEDTCVKVNFPKKPMYVNFWKIPKLKFIFENTDMGVNVWKIPMWMVIFEKLPVWILSFAKVKNKKWKFLPVEGMSVLRLEICAE